MTFDWVRHTAPFVDQDGREPARFVLRQVADQLFQLGEGFRYDPAGHDISVDSHSLVETDLASIPLFMAWFVPVNGRHTPAALVHDQLVAHSTDPGQPPDSRADADDVFLKTMTDTDMPILRRSLMHTAVTLATRFVRGGITRLGMILWCAASLVGTALLVWALWQHAWWVALAAALAPIPGGLLWGTRNARQGVLAGYAAWFVAIPAATTLAGYTAYYVAEKAIGALAVVRGTPRTDVPPPAPLR